MTDQYESHAAQRLAEETGEPRERFTADDKPLPELDELESVTDGGVDQDDGGTDRAGSRVSCAFCDLSSDYVLTVTDSAPDEMQIVEESLALPVCRSHFEEMEESAI